MMTDLLYKSLLDLEFTELYRENLLVIFIEDNMDLTFLLLSRRLRLLSLVDFGFSWKRNILIKLGLFMRMIDSILILCQIVKEFNFLLKNQSRFFWEKFLRKWLSFKKKVYFFWTNFWSNEKFSNFHIVLLPLKNTHKNFLNLINSKLLLIFT